MSELTISLLVEGGKASGGPPLATSIGPLGINVQKVVDEINNQTKAFAGVTVPVKVFVNKDTKAFRVEIGTPSVASLIKKELGIEKGAKAEPKMTPAPVGDMKMEQIIKIAKLKSGSMTARDVKAASISVIGTCASVGVTCEGASAKEAIKRIKKGEFDAKFK